MKESIKLKIENFVLEEMDKIQLNDESENVGNRNYAIENVKEFIKILQEDDKIEYNYKLESLKIENDKNDKENKNDIERSKISKDESFNNRKLDIEDKRIEIENKTNIKKIDNEESFNNRKLDIEDKRIEIENEINIKKIDNDEVFNNRKLDIEDKRIEIENKTNIKKIDNDFMINNRKLDIEEISGNESLKLKSKELAQEIVRDTMNDKVKLIDLGVQAAGIILPIIFYGSWVKKGLEFEKEGTFTSTTFKGLISKLKIMK